MHFATVLDQNRQRLLPYLTKIPKSFYLAGGTGLALHLGHRMSEDFDFFCRNPFDTQELLATLSQDIFADIALTVLNESQNSLDIITDSHVKLSFIHFRYELIYPLVSTNYFSVADYPDIAAMKLIAANQQASRKDYFDLYFILQHRSLTNIFAVAQKKYPHFNPFLYLKSLTYFEDCDDTPIKLLANKVTFAEVKSTLSRQAHQLFNSLTA